MSVTTSLDDDVAVITIDNPPVNATSHAVRVGLVDALADAERNPRVRAIVLVCAGRTFVAGADITEFGAPPKPPFLTDVTSQIENSQKPVVAALHGTALGGGFEIALSAHARVAIADAEFGLPEVSLGLIPGAGGTQRLPRLVGLEKALDLVTSGRRLSAEEGVALGVIDHISHGDLLAEAKTVARSLTNDEPRRTGRLSIPPFDSTAVDNQIDLIKRKARGQISPVRAAAMVRQAADLSLEDGLSEERATFLELAGSSQAAALRHAFAAERSASKVVRPDAPTVINIRRIGIAGAGLMGAGIAASCLDAGYDVRVIERDDAAAVGGRQRIEAIYARLKKSQRIDDKSIAERLERLGVFYERSAVADCDLVIEAVFDDASVKQELFASLSVIVRPDTILATNTSYLDPEVIASVVENPTRFLGLHFFSPANIMRLVEVVRTATVSDDVLDAAMGFVKRLRKIGVVTGVCEGFIGNRIFSAYRQECDFMLEDGALPQEIDAAMERFGFPMGPYAVNDLAGLDIAWARRKRKAATRDPAERYVLIADRLCEAGRLGQKAGRGYYKYEEGRRLIDPEVTAIIEAVSRDAGVTRRAFGAEEISSRVSAVIVAEGRNLIGEGIARQTSDIDVVMIHGYGYPAWRGGPMYEAGIS